jgi:hypothetical protein
VGTDICYTIRRYTQQGSIKDFRRLNTLVVLFITTQRIRARIVARLTHIVNATLLSVAEQIVVTVCTHLTRALVVLFITTQRIRARIVARQTIQYGIARLGTVTEQTVVTLAVVRCVVACAGILVAQVDRTAHPVVAVCISGATVDRSVLIVIIITASEKTKPKCQPRAQNHGQK